MSGICSIIPINLHMCMLDTVLIVTGRGLGPRSISGRLEARVLIFESTQSVAVRWGRMIKVPLE